MSAENRGWEMQIRKDDKGEQNVLFTLAGFCRGGYFHRKTLETLTILTGVVRFEIRDTHGRLHWFIAKKGSTVVVSLLHGYVFYALQDSLVLQDFNRPYDPKDVVSCQVSDYDMGVPE